jgi:type IV pilus assembly protein PilQ
MVVVDLVGVGKPNAASLVGAVRDEDQQIAAYDGVVDLVTLVTFDEVGGTPLTRVEIVMAVAGQAEVFSTGDGLEIRVVPTFLLEEVADDESTPEAWGAETQAAADDSAVDEPWQSNEATSEGQLMVAAPVEPPPAATQLTGVSASATDGGVLVALQADGAIGALEAFTLENPARLVIDLPGLTTTPSASAVSVDSTLVTGVRVGAHDGKVRVVVDGGPEAAGFEGRQIMPGTTGLWVAIGDGEALSGAMTDALAASEEAWLASAVPVDVPMESEAAAIESESMLEMTELAEKSVEEDGLEVTAAQELGAEETTLEGMTLSAEAIELTATETIEEAPPLSIETVEEVAPLSMETFELAEVYGLHYERTDGMDRTAILADDSVSYTTNAPDATTLVISITGAQISDDASDRIFPKAGGPISLIHAFQQPEVSVPEVRVVFTRAPNQEPVVSRRGSMIFVDFEDLGVAAAPPPAFPNAGGTDEVDVTPLVAAVEVSSPTFDEQIELEADAADLTASETIELDAPAPAAADAAPLLEVASDLPGFEDGTMLPGALDPASGSMWDAPVDVSLPAAVEVPAAIEVLEEGGLIDGKDYRGRRVSLDFKDVQIADVLRLIAEVSDLNIIAGDEVAGNVTIRLVEVPWDQALDVILMTKGLGFVRVGNVLRIAPSDVLKAEEEVRLQERRNKEKLEDLEVKLLPVNYATVRDTEGLVKRLLSARGTVNLDERTNTLIIKDISSVIDEASALIAAIDTQTPQVVIEAKIVEANLDFSRELGSVWSVQTNQFEDAFDPDEPRRDLGSEDLNFIGNNGLAFANPITSVPTGLISAGALILDSDFRVDAQIQAAESTGDGKVVSSPRIVTLDNKEARIEQGVSIPFQTFEGGDAKLEFIDAVLSLIVTPHITADESIIMEIEVTRNAPDSTVPTPTGSPAIAKNVAETETLVKDGQTLVLGGIYTITKAQEQRRARQPKGAARLRDAADRSVAGNGSELIWVR